MLFMVTSRRKVKETYGDEEKPNFRYDYLYNHLNGSVGADGFGSSGKRGFEIALLQELNNLKDNKGINTPKVGVYLHGYNNDWQDSIDELVDMHQALGGVIGYSPVLVGFSWPSTGRTLDYLSDREEARDSVPAFVRFLRDINGFLIDNERNCFSTTYCIAHSMGNYLLRKGMEYLSDHLGTPLGRAMFNETVMLAPDLSAGDIENDGKGSYIAAFSRRVHVYYSKYDRALKASSAKRFGGNRLGRHGADDYRNLPSNVVVVDAQKYAKEKGAAGLKDRRGEQVSVHSSHRYHPSILKDVEHVLSSVDRSVIDTREVHDTVKDDPTAPKNHFQLK
jgi:esterase/lipase superfamily enzyme